MASSDGSIILETRIDDSGLTKGLKEIEKSGEKASKGLNDVGESSGGLKNSFGVAESAVGNFVGNALSNLTSKIGDTISSFVALGDETREYREDIAKLETAFSTQGHSVDAAKNSYTDFYKIIGESDRSVEAVNHLAELTNNEKELSQWSTIAAGVTAKFGDSLPIEGLTEAANETAKVGKVIGPLADALNWAGISEDEFNGKLATCNDEQERSALITETLCSQYQEAADEYNNLTAETQAAREAQAKMEETQANIGKAIEPVTTAWKNLKGQALEAITPVVEKLSGAFEKMIDWLQAHPAVLAGLAGALAALAGALAVVTAAVVAQTVAQWAQNAAWLASPITWIVIGIVAAVGALVAIFVVLWNKCDGFREFFVNMWEKIKSSFQSFVDYVRHTLESIKDSISNAFSAAWEAVKAIWDKVSPYFQMVWENIKVVFSVAKDVLGAAFSAAWEIIKAVWDTATGFFQAIWDTIAGIFSVVSAVLSGDWSAAWEAIKGIVGTWGEFFSRIWENIKSVFGAVGSFFKSVFTSAWNGIKQAFANVGQFFATVWQNIKNAFKFSEMLNIGKNIVEGLWNGISNMTAWIAGKIKSFCSNALQAIKDFFGIHSPSRVMRDEVGKQLVVGMAIGIEDASDMIADAFGSLTDDTRNEVQKLQDEWNNAIFGKTKSQEWYEFEAARISLEREEKSWQDKIDAAEEAYKEEKKNAQERLDEKKKEASKSEDIAKAQTEYEKSIQEATAKYEEKLQDIHNERMAKEQERAEDEYLNGLKETAEKEQKMLEARAKDIENLKKNIISAYKDMAEEAISDIEKLQNTQEQFAEKLSSYGSVFTEKSYYTLAGEQKYNVLSGLGKQTDTLEKYYAALMAVKERSDVPAEFFDTLREMSVDDGLEYATKLMNLSDKSFSKYIEDWKRKQSVSEQISKELYKDEADQLANEITEKFDVVEDEFFGVGENAADQFEDGFMDRLKDVLDNIKGSISGAFSTLLPTSIGMRLGNDVVNNVPALARGAVIPPNRRFMAVLGDQTHGTNIEAPAALIKQMAKEAYQEMGLASGQGQRVVREEHYNLNQTELMRIVYKLYKGGERLNGASLVDGGVV